MANAEFVKKARKPNPVVTQEDIDRANAGEAGAASYYKWSFRFGGTHYSKTYPRPSQLTQSEYLSAVYALQEEIADAATPSSEELVELRDTWAEQARAIGEECRDRFDNMPEGFQEGDTGQLLERRADAMDTWADEIECVEADFSDIDDEDMCEAEWVAQQLDELQAIEPEIE